MSKLRIGIITLVLALLGGMGLAGAEPVAPAPAPDGSSLEQRIEQRRKEREITLSEKDQKRLVSVCERGQTKLRTLGTKEVPVLQKRTVAYREIDGDLWIAIGQLKLADEDTFNLEEQRAELAEKVVAYEILATNYKQALDDIILINCKADPVAFQSVLDTARIYNDSIRTQLEDSRDYVINTIKPTLKGFVSTLEAKNKNKDN